MKKNQTRIPMERLEQIIKEEDYSALFELKEDRDFGYVLSMILHKYHDCKDLNSLPQSHKMLFLCKVVEDCCQADCIYTFVESGFSKYSDDTYTALKEINAPLSAEAFKQACSILNEKVDVENDIDNLTDEDWEQLSTYDRVISNYSDGHFSKLYRAYAEKYKDDFVL
ncbi:MAG: hypothetical protein R3Y09_09695 [Clostridia bacterium]